MAQRKGLGKGLDALIPGGKSSIPLAKGGHGGIQQVAVEAIKRNPRQPRVHFKEEELDELASSIREHGVIQPLIVSPKNDGTFILIAGERRWQAAQRAGLKTVPVVTRQASNQEFLELALIENVQRADLNPMEEAEAYHQLADDFGLSHEMIARRVGKSRVAVTNTMRLTNLADPVKQALVDNRITEGHARALLGLSTQKAQTSALQTIINLSLSVRQAEELVRKLTGQRPVKVRKFIRNADVSDVEKRLQRSLGTKVTLKHGKKGGTVTIYYYSDEELNALLKKMT
ncbi:MAG: ParB/RepB/Spo0J family partition protein [Anaerolineales bacterium]|nr:MAG: ParB/RepB/Spo0J family partition protein [Chloroflexota bacterium]MBE7436418.1 ParB/RepB/Spo0J family partition protein [Anaerolineales bacterium]MCE7859191.1 ParB/RepB/Spo0J family partition protein [Chloroflexi bacterium CFX2]MCK6581825.1 ParB/RepB/Spo0J family partition protein [Anaerolineales bacterium]